MKEQKIPIKVSDPSAIVAKENKLKLLGALREDRERRLIEAGITIEDEDDYDYRDLFEVM